MSRLRDTRGTLKYSISYVCPPTILESSNPPLYISEEDSNVLRGLNIPGSCLLSPVVGIKLDIPSSDGDDLSPAQTFSLEDREIVFENSLSLAAEIWGEHCLPYSSLPGRSSFPVQEFTKGIETMVSQASTAFPVSLKFSKVVGPSLRDATAERTVSHAL